jgi:hypothetical protein
MEYLKIRNWDKWQTYRRDRGQPPWIKVHRCLLRDHEWVSMTDAERGQLISIWLLGADRDGVIPASPEMLQKLCFMETAPNLEKLIGLNFIESTPCQPDVKLTPTWRQPDPPEAEAEANTEIESETEEIWAFSQTLDIPQPKIKKSIVEIQGIIKARLKDGYTAEDLIWHLQRYMEKKKAHGLYLERHGKDPEPGTPAWCPMVT